MLLHTFVRRIAGVAMTAALAAGSALAHAATDAGTVAQAVERMRVAMVASDGASGSRGISVHWAAWYRSALPGQTVPAGWLCTSSWWNHEPLTWSIT